MKVMLRWYARDGHDVTGRATLYPAWYLAREGKTEFSLDDWCGGTTG